MLVRFLVALGAGTVGLLAYLAGVPRWLAGALALGILVLADRLNVLPSPYQPSVRSLLNDVDDPSAIEQRDGKPMR
jgi:hypothetical protein